MGGGLMQLVAYGAQDVYLTGNPQITFFKVVYRRHTNFSIESIEQSFNGTADFGKKVSCTISRNGDLVHRIYLQTTLPQVNIKYDSVGTTNKINGGVDLKYGMARWCNWVGEKLVNFVEIEIGGQKIDKHYGEWLHIWNQLTTPAGHSESYQRMVGNVPKLTKPHLIGNTANDILIGDDTGTKLFIPLQFWFCRNPGLALPLIALQYHEVKINVEFEDLKNLFIAYSGGTSTGTAVVSKQPASGVNLNNTSLWVDYIFLDTDERRRFAQLSHEYLIEQLQFPGEETITSATSKIRLNFNHPVKELIWVAQKNVCNANLQHFNYTDTLDSSPTLSHDLLGSRMLQGIIENIAYGVSGSRLPLTTILTDVGVNTCSLAKLQLNGQDRFSERTGDYFNYVQPYNHHTSAPHIGINVYSFSLKPEEHQPSGTCNFSRIDNANLFLTVTANTTKTGDVSIVNTSSDIASEGSLIAGSGATGSAKVRVYATNYNVLRIMSGMGGLAYSN